MLGLAILRSCRPAFSFRTGSPAIVATGKLPNRHTAPASLTNRPLPVPFLLNILLLHNHLHLRAAHGHYTQGSRLSEKYYITGDPQPRTMDWPDWPQRVARILPGIDSSARSATAAAFLFNTRRATTKSVTRILSSVMACSTEVGLLECVYLAQSHPYS